MFGALVVRGEREGARSSGVNYDSDAQWYGGGGEILQGRFKSNFDTSRILDV